MSVSEHGLEAIRKSTVAISAAEDQIRTLTNSALINVAYDYISATYPTETQEVYVYKTGGSGGTTVATITVNYTDSTKTNISNVART
jgi:hypothetical protein